MMSRVKVVPEWTSSCDVTDPCPEINCQVIAGSAPRSGRTSG
jgi:hypothetical protein